MKRKQGFFWFMVLVILAGCRRDAEVTPTPIPTAEPTTAAATAVTETPVAETATPTALVEATATATMTVVPPTATAMATQTVAATVSVPATATNTPIPTATAEPGIVPGQQDTAALAVGASKAYPYTGIKFQSVLLFVEPAATLDVSLTAVAAGETEPLNEANFSQAGGPEIMVFTPQEDGDYDLIVTAVAGEGNFTFHLFDSTTIVPRAVVQADSVAAGESKSYTVQSNGSRPVLVFVEPDSSSDVAVQVRTQSGETVTEANFGGQASSEAVFVLPLQTTTYTVVVSGANNEAATYNILIVPLASIE